MYTKKCRKYRRNTDRIRSSILSSPVTEAGKSWKSRFSVFLFFRQKEVARQRFLSSLCDRRFAEGKTDDAGRARRAAACDRQGGEPVETGIGYPDINTLEPLVDALRITLTELMNCARDEEIIASLEIARSQRKRMVKRIAGGGVLCIAGMFMLLYALKLFITRTWTFMLPGSDGPTAVFVAGRIGNFPPAVIVIGIIGGAALVLGIVTIIRANNTDH